MLSSLLFPASILIGSSLLFLLELVTGKYLLPRFGSSAGVWMTCLMFFQVALLAGYAYADRVRRLPLRRQAYAHGMLLVTALGIGMGRAVLGNGAVTPAPAWQAPQAPNPIAQILIVLTAGMALPFVVLSSSGPLLQHWLSRLKANCQPYRLYALSNAGSIVGLISYPLLIEPLLPMRQQLIAWSAGAMVFALVTLGCAAVVLSACRRGSIVAAESVEVEDIPPRPPRGSAEAEDPTPGFSLRAMWVALATCGCILMMATTNQMCQDVSPVPLLWVLPLSVYLATFVVGFSRASHRLREAYPWLGASGLLLAWFALNRHGSVALIPQVTAYTAALFLIGLFCHGVLYQTRPGVAHLTGFYMFVALGGAIGGVSVSLLAPLLFKGYWEYHLGLVLASLLLAWVAVRRRRDQPRGLHLAVFLAMPFLTLALAGRDISETKADVVETCRDFYGVLSVHRQVKGGGQDGVKVYSLMNGRIVHGIQPDRSSYRFRPTLYYTEESGVGLAVSSCRERHRDAPLRLGGVGLGVGTVAAYGRRGDTMRFYEINPSVIRYASDSRFFTYLRDTMASVDVVRGDGRISLTRELEREAKGDFDVLVLDAFTGDAVPTHLLTKEAFEVYRRHLKPDGIIAWHATNRYLDFVPLGVAMGKEMRLSVAVIETVGDGKISASATWILLTPAAEALKAPAILNAALKNLDDTPRVSVWTDDYSSIYPLMRRRVPAVDL